MCIRGKTYGDRRYKVEAFVAGMYLGEFVVDLRNNHTYGVDLDLWCGSGWLEFNIQGIRGHMIYGLWIDWMIDIWDSGL